jgi:hypothetical protein
LKPVRLGEDTSIWKTSSNCCINYETEAAQATRLDSLRWARYGFGDTDGALAREQAQLAVLLRLEDQ